MTRSKDLQFASNFKNDNRSCTAYLLVFTSIFILLQACVGDKVKEIPDVQSIDPKLRIIRFDQALANLDTNDIANEWPAMFEEYPDFSPIFFNQVMDMRQSDPNDSLYQELITGFLKSPQVRRLMDTVQLVYGDLGETKNTLEQAMQFYQFYFPEAQVPRLYTYTSEYSYAAFVADPDIWAVGLDFFLGADYEYYDPTFFPRYIKRTMNKAHLPVRAVEASGRGYYRKSSG